MRIPHWPALVYGLVLAATIGRSVVAAPPKTSPPSRVTLANAIDEDADDDESDSESAPGGYAPYRQTQAVAPVPGSLPAAPAPAPEAYYGPGVAAPNAWPGSSPFTQHRIEETYNDSGLWQYNSDDEFDPKRYFAVEYLYGSGLKPGNHYIGSDRNHNLYFFPNKFGTFPTHTTELFGNVPHNGLKANLGTENPDGSGVNFSGYILFQNTLDNGLVGYHATAGQINTLRALGGIVVDQQNGQGLVLPFDSRFYQSFTQEIMGSDLDIYLSPFFERQSFKMKFLWGAKYLRFSEQFYVQGDDSGLSYVAGSGQAGGGGVGAGGFDPTSISGPFTRLLNPYTTVFQSSTTANLVGPQLGVRYDLGGDKFKIWGQSRMSVAANVQSMTVSSSNVGAYKAPGLANTVIAGPDLPFLVTIPATSHKITNTSISPIFDTAIYGEFPGFELIPWVNQWQLFKNAKMRVGWQYTYVGEVARAAGIIQYNLHEAGINVKRSWFEFSTVNFAVDWRF